LPALTLLIAMRPIDGNSVTAELSLQIWSSIFAGEDRCLQTL
jgi:hypothetical protein